jgi:hypothetical protein
MFLIAFIAEGASTLPARASALATQPAAQLAAQPAEELDGDDLSAVKLLQSSVALHLGKGNTGSIQKSICFQKATQLGIEARLRKTSSTPSGQLSG